MEHVSKNIALKLVSCGEGFEKFTKVNEKGTTIGHLRV